MPRYFFHLEDGETDLDPEGVELSDPQAAMVEAVQMMGQLLKEQPDDIVSYRGLKLIVSNEVGLILFILDLSAVAAPALMRRTA